MDDLAARITTGIIGFIAAYLLTFLQPKAKLFFWAPHSFYFKITQDNAHLFTQAITIQNLGRLSAKKVEIIFDKSPDFFCIRTQI